MCASCTVRRRTLPTGRGNCCCTSARAADAWPLVNFKDLDEFNSRMLCGEPTLEPRVEKVPVRMPLPPALAQGSIYENQTALRNRFFEVKAAAT